MFPTCYGSEFISRDLDLWAYSKHVTLDFSRPGKPTDNGFIEAFNSKLRSECLNAHWFMSLADAAEKLEDWRRHYNDDRPHSAIGYNVPSALHFPGGVTSPPPWPRPETPALDGPKLVGRARVSVLQGPVVQPEGFTPHPDRICMPFQGVPKEGDFVLFPRDECRMPRVQSFERIIHHQNSHFVALCESTLTPKREPSFWSTTKEAFSLPVASILIV